MGFLRIDKVLWKIQILFLLFLTLVICVYASQYGKCMNQCDSDMTACENDCYVLYCEGEGGCEDEYDGCMDDCDTDYDLCELACKAIDEDGDGINDHNDSIIGTSADVTTEGISNLTVYVGQYRANESNSSTTKNSETVRFVADNVTVVEFEQDFSISTLSLVDVEVRKQKSSRTHGMVVRGINQSTAPRKTIYIDKIHTDGAICIKDAEIDSIDEFDRDCLGEDELFFGRCEDGETIGDYSCSIENGRYKIEGLQHSGAVEMNISGIFSGFFTVRYLNTLDNHVDGYLMPGETVSICFESARPIRDDERLQFTFVPGVGGLSRNEMWTPDAFSFYNVHIYP